MRRLVRFLGLLLILGGVAALCWSFVVWRWEDPLTGLYTAHQQRALAQELEARREEAQPTLAADPGALAVEARRYRRGSQLGHGIGRIVVPRIGVNMVLVYGTDHDSLKKGPGLDPRTFFPGQGRLVYIAGHRTTYAAPFSHIDALRRGDVIRLEMPYATFTYRVTGHRIVRATDITVLRTKGFEQVALQACHPRFFATHRWIAYGKLVGATADGRPVSAEASG